MVVCGRWIGGYAVEIGGVRVSDTPPTDYFFALPSPYNPHVVVTPVFKTGVTFP